MLIYLGLNGFLLLRQGQAARSEAHGGIQQKELTAAVQEAERLVRELEATTFEAKDLDEDAPLDLQVPPPARPGLPAPPLPCPPAAPLSSPPSMIS